MIAFLVLCVLGVPTWWKDKVLDVDFLRWRMMTIMPCAMTGPAMPAQGCHGETDDWDFDGDVDMRDVHLALNRLGSNVYGYRTNKGK